MNTLSCVPEIKLSMQTDGLTGLSPGSDWCWGPVGCLALSLSASTCSWRCWNMNEWKSRAQFESWLGWGTRACQSLYIRWKYTLDQTLLGASWDPYLSDPSPWDPTSASLRTSGIWQGVYALLPHPLLANCNSCNLGGWGFLRASPPPRRSWESAVFSQASHLKPWPSETMAELLHALHFPITTLITKTKGFRWSQ